MRLACVRRVWLDRERRSEAVNGGRVVQEMCGGVEILYICNLGACMHTCTCRDVELNMYT